MDWPAERPAREPASVIPERALRVPGMVALCAALAGSLAADPSVAQRRQRLDLVRLSIELPGIPAAVIPADLDGDGRGDLVVVLAYTEWSQISFSEEVEIDEVADVVEMMTVVPSLADRRELLVYRGLPGGGFEAAGPPWPLPRGVLGVEPGPSEQPVLVLHDEGVAALRIPMEGDIEPRLEPVVEVRSVLSGSRSLLPQLGLTPDVDGDGERDLLVPRRDDVAVYVSHGGRIEPRLAGAIAWPPRGRTGPAVGRIRRLPLPELRDVDGDRLPDALFLHPNASYQRFWVARGRGGGAFDPPIAPVGDRRDRRAELLSELELGPGRSVDLDDLQVAWFGDLDGDGVAEYVLAQDLSDDEAGMRKGMKQAKNPPFRYRVLPSGAELSPAGEVRTTFEGLGYAFAGDEEIRLPGGFQDLDGDGRQDLVTITLDFSIFQAVRVLATRSLSIGMDFHVWCQQEDGGFRPVAGVDLSGKFKLDLDDLRLGQLSMFAGDFDGDGRADFVQMGRGRRVTIHRGESGCAYAERPDLVVELREEPRNLALVRVEDLDGDRLADLLVVQPQPWPRDGATQPVRLDFYVSGARE